MKFAIQGLLGRCQALRIKSLSSSSDIHTHPQHDPGCLNEGHNFLRPFINQYSHALLIFDRQGSGSRESRETLEKTTEALLSRNGWNDRAAAIVIDPCLENWVWSDSPQVDAIAGWEGKKPDLRTWLARRQYLAPGQNKPSRPKEAFEEALRQVGKQRSSKLYEKLALKVSLDRCSDPAFLKLRDVLSAWFSLRTKG